MTANLLTRVRNCVRERRLPYAVERRLYSPTMLPLHRMLLDPQLKRTDREPTYISLDEAHQLQNQHRRRDDYKYDLDSKQARAAARTSELAKVIDLSRPINILELGGGDGQLMLSLAHRGHHCTLLDVQDWRDKDVVDSPVRFTACDASQSFPFNDSTFDLCISFNSLEHISNPSAAFGEMLRVLKPRGTMYHTFCPLYNSAWGLHAYRHIYFPYAQFLLDPESLAQFIDDVDAHGYGTSDPSLVYVNGWHLRQYLALFSSHVCKLHSLTLSRSLDHLNIAYRHSASFRGRGLDTDELVTEGITVSLTKL